MTDTNAMSKTSSFPVISQTQPPLQVVVTDVSPIVLPVVEQFGSDNLDPFLDKEYRDEYLDGYVKSSIANQIHALRVNAALTQYEFAAKLGTTQSIVSRLEDAEYGSVTVSTLLKIAKQNDVALNIRFVDYPTMLTCDVSADAARVDSIFESYELYKQGEAITVIQEMPNILYSPLILISISTNITAAVPNSSGAIIWQSLPPPSPQQP